MLLPCCCHAFVMQLSRPLLQKLRRCPTAPKEKPTTLRVPARGGSGSTRLSWARCRAAGGPPPTRLMGSTRRDRCHLRDRCWLAQRTNVGRAWVGGRDSLADLQRKFDEAGVTRDGKGGFRPFSNCCPEKIAWVSFLQHFSRSMPRTLFLWGTGSPIARRPWRKRWADSSTSPYVTSSQILDLKF